MEPEKLQSRPIRMDDDTHYRLKMLAHKHKMRIGLMIRKLVLSQERREKRR